MRRTLTLFLFAAVAGSTLVHSRTAALPQKPVKEVTTYPSWIAPPATLNETFLSTDLIVRGRVVRRDQRDKPSARGTYIRTGHRVEVLDVFRAPAGSDPQGDEITVIQGGGDRDRGAYIERLSTHGFPQLQSGREYVLFLARAEGGTWGSAYGPDGVFERAGDRVLPFGTSEVSRRQAKVSWEAFVQLLWNYGIERGRN